MNVAQAVPAPADPEAFDWIVDQLERMASDRYGAGSAGYRRSRRSANGRCPWHDDHAPSISVFGRGTSHPRFRCHACGERGDSLDLARTLGLALPENALRDARSTTSRAAALECSSAFAWERRVARAFLETLPVLTSLGPSSPQRAYLRSRGIADETVVALDLRAPIRDHPYRAQEHARLPLAEMLSFVETAASLGLCRLNRRGYQTRYGSKVLVPVTDTFGDLHLICGRTAHRDCATDRRYQRWSARALGDSSVSLWPLNGPGVLDGIRRSRVVVLVPGFVEAAALWQSGATNVLALLGDRVPTDAEFRLLREIGAERVVFALHLDQEAGSGSRAEAAAAVAGVKWGIPAVVDAFRGDDGQTRDADELAPDRLRSEHSRLLTAVGAAPLVAGGELGAAAAARSALLRANRMRRADLGAMIGRYRELKSLAGHRRARAFIESALPLRLLRPGPALRPGTFAVPDPSSAVPWKTTIRKTGEFDEQGVPWHVIGQEPPVLELLVLLCIASAQEAAWARRSPRGVPIKMSTLARRLGVATSAVERALARLEAWGSVARYRPFAPGIRAAPADGIRRRFRTQRYVAFGPRVPRDSGRVAS